MSVVRQKLFLIVLLTFSCAVTLFSSTSFAARSEKFVIDTSLNGTASKYIMKGKRFRRDGAPPIVMAHGFLNSQESMEVWAEYFYEAGYDVWIFNHLGFGLKGQTSVARNYHRGDYSFMNLLNGMDQVIQHVRRETNQKITYVSFSMGGMTFYQYLAGGYAEGENGRPIRSQRLAQERQTYFDKSITIGAPSFDLNGLSPIVNLAAYAGKALLEGPLRYADFFVPLGLNGSETSDSTIGLVVSRLQSIIGEDFWKRILADAMYLPNMGEHRSDLRYVLSRTLSNPHTDILRSFAKMVVYSHDISLPELSIKNLALIGSRDRLAPPEELLKMQQEFAGQEIDHHAILLGGYGHYDLMFNPAIALVGKKVLSFLKDPERFTRQTPPLLLVGKSGNRERALERDFYALLATQTIDRRISFERESEMQGRFQSCEYLFSGAVSF